MKRSVGALLMIGISAFGVSAGPVAAATAGAATLASDADGTTVPVSALAVAASGTTDPRQIDVSADPGGSVKRAIVVKNNSADLRLTVRLSAVDRSGLGGDAAHDATTAPNAPNGGPSSWITLSDVVETLEPGANATVSVSVAVPSNAVPGAMVAGLLVRVERAVRVSNGAAVSGNPSVSLPVAVKVLGVATAQVSIVSVREVQVEGRDNLEIQFQNVGATSMMMRGKARVAGKVPASYAVEAQVAPLGSTVVHVRWVKPAGSSGVAVSVETDAPGGDQASWHGLIGATTPAATHLGSTSDPGTAPAASRSAHSPDFVFVLVALVLAAVWLAYEWLRTRARRRAVARMHERVTPATASGLPAPAQVPTAAASTALVPAALVSAELVPAQSGVSAAQLSEVVTQLAALVGAIDRLVGRIDGQVGRPAAARADARPLATSAVPTASSATVSPPPPIVSPAAPATPAPPVTATPPTRAPAVAESDTYPYDWPTAEELDRFVERRRSSGTEFQ